jgi:SAM-dependent methyltransferase
VREGIPLLAVHGTAETWTGSQPPATSAEYQQAYEDFGEARGYNEAYRRERTKRWSTAREYQILSSLLATQPKSEILLDIPSGGGRLSAALAPHTQLLVEADIGFGQLLYNRGNHADREGRVWMTASAFHIPFRDSEVDGVVCCRLCHHLPTAEERERLIAELLRVSRRFVIMTYFDYHSVKNLLRRARAPFDKKPPKMTMTTDRVAELARLGGAKLEAWPALSRLFSGHRYALMVKR